MATLHIASKDDKAKASKIESMIDSGELPKPPALHGKANTCAKCGKLTMLARFYIPQVGYGCEECFDEWRTTPVRCSTRASDVHIGCVHIIPQCVIDAEAKQNTHQTRQDGRSEAEDELSLAEQIKHFDARQAEDVWTRLRREHEVKRGNVMVMPWKQAA